MILNRININNSTCYLWCTTVSRVIDPNKNNPCYWNNIEYTLALVKMVNICY